MKSWIRGLVASTAAIGVMAGSLVAGTSAHAAVGDTATYDISQEPGDTKDLYDVTLGPDGLLWVFDDDEDEFLRVDASAEVKGVVPAANCDDDERKVTFGGSLFCLYDSENILRFYSDGRRTTYGLPADFSKAHIDSMKAVTGPDGRLWIVASTTETFQEINTDLNVDPFVRLEMRLIAAPMSENGDFGSVITVNRVTGTFNDSRAPVVSAEAGPENRIYFSWSPGFNIYNGDVTNVYGTFTTDGVVQSSRVVGDPRTVGANAGKSARVGDSIYVLGVRYETVPIRGSVNNVQTDIVDLDTNQQLYNAAFLSPDGTFSVFTSPTTVTTQNIAVDVHNLEDGNSDFVPDSSGYLWVTDSSDEQLIRLTTAGVVADRVAIPLGETPYAVAIGSDGNAWVAADDILVRVLTGAVPTNAAAPTLSQVDGVTAGTPISGTSGEWNDPSGTYEYQWQVCSSNDASTCTDIPGATAAQYTPSTADDGKYVRMATYATSANGRSEPAYSGLVAVGAPAAPPAAAPGAAVKATGSTAVIGNAQTMELDVPRKTKRGKKKFYEVFFTATDVPGTVTFTFKRRSKVKTVTVPIEDGIAEYRWKTPKKWPRGKTRVTATYVPSAGSPYTAAAVTDRVKVRGR